MRGWGKLEVLAQSLFREFIYSSHPTIFVFSPFGVGGDLSKRFCEILKENKKEYEIKDDSILVDGGGEVRFEPTSKPNTLDTKPDYTYFDEACVIDKEIYDCLKNQE